MIRSNFVLCLLITAIDCYCVKKILHSIILFLNVLKDFDTI